MKVATFSDLIVWTREMHHRLSKCLAECSTQPEQELSKMLLVYLADHEAALEKIVDGFEKRANSVALNTWVYDYLENEPIDPRRTSDTPYAQMSFDEICGSVFDLHNQVITLYRNMLDRAEIPDLREFLCEIVEMEKHETMRLAQQINRIQDM